MPAAKLLSKSLDLSVARNNWPRTTTTPKHINHVLYIKK